MVVTSKRQAGDLSPAALAAGVAIYEEWEEEHHGRHESYAAPYAVRELIAAIIAAANSVEGHAPERS